MNFIKKIVTSSLFKITSLNSVSVILKIVIGVVTSKVIAIFIGPSGMALVGNFRNFLSTIQGISTLGFENGVVKYIAENKEDKGKIKKTISTALISVFVFCIIICFVLFFLAEYLNTILFGINFNYTFIIKTLVFALPFFVGNIFLVSILNGFGKYSKVVYVTIFGSIIGLLLSVILISNLNVNGALLSIVLTPSLLFFVSFYYLNKEVSIVSLLDFENFNFKLFKNLLSYTLMAIVPVTISPYIMLSIRKNIINNIGIEQAGYWEATTRIATYYFMFVSTLLVIYYLPKLSISKSNIESKKIVLSYFKNILPLFALCLLVLFFFKNIVITILFTKEFLPVTKLFFWQFFGDILKAASLILGYQFYAKKLTFSFICFEITSFSIMYFSSNFFLKLYGIEGVVMAHCFTYLVYLVLLMIYFRKILNG